MFSKGLFNQLASEVPFYLLLDQIEAVVHGPDAIRGTGQSFFVDLWANEVASSPFQPPSSWKYLPVEEAVEAYRKIFGSGLDADMVLAMARQAKARKDSEGIAVWLKLSALAKLSGVTGDPLATTDEGRAAYARVVEMFIPEVGRALTKAYPNFGFQNYREGALTAQHIVLTPAGRASWQRLESATTGYFCFSPAGANTGNLYAGHSVRRSRIRVASVTDKMPQDCIMAGQTIATQPDRLTKYEDLGIDCIGNAYSPDAGGQFGGCVSWSFRGGRLGFVSGWAGHAIQSWGAASVSLS